MPSTVSPSRGAPGNESPAPWRTPSSARPPGASPAPPRPSPHALVAKHAHGRGTACTPWDTFTALCGSGRDGGGMKPGRRTERGGSRAPDRPAPSLFPSPSGRGVLCVLGLVLGTQRRRSPGGQSRPRAARCPHSRRPRAGRNEWTRRRCAEAAALGHQLPRRRKAPPHPPLTNQRGPRGPAPPPASPSANERGPAALGARRCSRILRRIKFFGALNFFFKAPAAVPAAAGESGRVPAPPLPVAPPGAGAL